MIQSSNSELERSYFLKAPRAAIKPEASDTPGDFKLRSRDRGERRKSPGLPGAAIAIFPDHRDRRIKSPISEIPDICNFVRRSGRSKSPRSANKSPGVSQV